MEFNKIYQMDCLDGLRELNNECIDLTVTSPPYEDLRKYNGYSWDFESIAKELYRVTKPGGVVVWIVGDRTKNGTESGESFKQALFFKEIGFNLHDTMIYMSHKRPLTHRRYEQRFEYMFVFAKGKPKTFNPIMEACKYSGTSMRKSTFRQDSGQLKAANNQKDIKPHKIKGNVWEYGIGHNKSTTDLIAFGHPAIFPEQLAYDHIVSWSNPGDVVLDPFMGSGTTAKMCLLSSRAYLGFEISEAYYQIAQKRISDFKKINC